MGIWLLHFLLLGGGQLVVNVRKCHLKCDEDEKVKKRLPLFLFGLTFCLKVSQPFWVIQSQSHPCRKTLGVLSNPLLGMISVIFWPFDPAKNAIQGDAPEGSDTFYERKSRGRKFADKMGRGKKKSHNTLIDWRTGREWPLNCMIVISAWWRLNIRFQRSRGRSRGRWTIIQLSQDRSQASWVPDSWRRNVVGKAASGRRGLWALMSWGPEKMTIRCRKESHHPAEWPLELRLSIKRTIKTQCDGHKSEGQNIAVSVRSPAPSHSKTPHNLFEPLQIKWDVNIFIKKSHCVCLYYCVVMIRHMRI